MAGPPLDQLVQAIQESRAILQTSSVLLSQEGEAAAEIEAGDEQDPELWDQDEDEAEGMEGSEETHSPGGPTVDLTQARKTAAECKPIMPPQQKRTRTEEPETVAKGSTPLSQVQRLSTRVMQNPRDTEVDTLSQGACARIPALASSLDSASSLSAQLLGSVPVSAWVDTGQPAKVLMTTLDSPDILGPNLTPTQELQTCVLKRRKTRGIRWENRVCRACEKVLKPNQAEWAHVFGLPCVGLLGAV